MSMGKYKFLRENFRYFDKNSIFQTGNFILRLKGRGPKGQGPRKDTASRVPENPSVKF